MILAPLSYLSISFFVSSIFHFTENIPRIEAPFLYKNLFDSYFWYLIYRMHGIKSLTILICRSFVPHIARNVVFGDVCICKHIRGCGSCSHQIHHHHHGFFTTHRDAPFRFFCCFSLSDTYVRFLDRRSYSIPVPTIYPNIVVWWYEASLQAKIKRPFHLLFCAVFYHEKLCSSMYSQFFLQTHT